VNLTLQQQLYDFITPDSSVDDDYNNLLDILGNAINRHTYKSKSKKSYIKQPWMSIGLLTSCKQKQTMYFSMLKGKCTITDYKYYKNKLTKLIRVAKKKLLPYFYQ
jgi:hypothetical protein